jgi:hypothetical protein
VDWDERLFAYLDDLEQEAEARFGSEPASQLGDRARAEYAAVTLAGRLLASVDREIVLEVRGVGAVTGRLQRVGPDWCLVESGSRAWVVRLEHVLTVEGASGRSVPEVARSPVARLGIGSVLRGVADSGEQCLICTADGSSYEVAVRRMGRDFVEVVTGQDRVLLLPLGGVAAVRTSGNPNDR